MENKRFSVALILHMPNDSVQLLHCVNCIAVNADAALGRCFREVIEDAPGSSVAAHSVMEID